MKSRCRLILMLLLPALAAIAEAQPVPLATVQTLSGQLQVQRGGASSDVAERAALFNGDVTATGGDSKATLLFSEGSRVSLNAGTIIELNTSPVGSKRTLFRLIKGEAFAQLRPGLAVQTRSATAAVRGTTFDLKVDEQGVSTLVVLEGSVDFFNPFGAVAVGQSQQSTARPGAAPTAPITIGNAGLLVEWTLDLSRAVVPREKKFLGLNGAALQNELKLRRARAQNAPNDGGARRDLGDALFDSGFLPAALQEYQQADRLRPRQAATLARIGDVWLEVGRLDAAEASFRAALAAAPAPDAPAHIGLAWLALKRDRPGEAQEAAQLAVAANDSSEARIVLGLSLLRQAGKASEARQAFEDAVKVQPAALHYQARAWLALLLAAQNDSVGALAQGRLATRLAPASALAHGNLALALFFAGQSNEAVRAARLAVRLNPDSPAAQVALAQSFLAQGDVDAAQRSAARAVALDPKLPQARYVLALADAQRLDYVHAARGLSEAMRLAPDFLPAAGALARVYVRMGREKEAVALLTDLTARRPGQGDEVQAALGEVFYEQGNYKASAQRYGEAARLRPNSALYQAGLARTLLYSNQLGPALQAARKAVFLAPTVSQYHSILGLALAFSRLDSYSEREFRKAIILNPQDALARVELGLEAREPRISFNSLSQAFLFDPAVSEQLLLGGIDTTFTPQITPSGRNEFTFENRSRGADGAFHSYFGVNRARSGTDEGRANERTRDGLLGGYATYQVGPRNTFLANFFGFRSKQGLPGPQSSPNGPDLDDHSVLGINSGQLSLRSRVLGEAGSLWAALVYERTRFSTLDPDAQSFPTNSSGLPLISQVGRTQSLNPELRFDWTPNRTATHPLLLSVGGARARPEVNLRYDPGPLSEFDPLTIPIKQRLWMAYLQAAQQVNDRLFFVAQLRRQRFVSQAQDSAADLKSEVLPSLIVTYQATKRAALRLFANRRTNDPVPLALTPTESLITTENEVLPQGSADLTRTLALEAEFYTSPSAFIKLFTFQSRARGLGIGGGNAANPPSFNLDRVRRAGVGVRYERQLSPRLFMALSYIANRTTAEAPGQAFNLGIAPYQPRRLAGVTLNYLAPSGIKVLLAIDSFGSFYQDSPLVRGRPRFPARTYADLRVARETSLHQEIFVQVTNLFNKSRVAFNGFPTGRRQVSFGVIRRF